MTGEHARKIASVLCAGIVNRRGVIVRIYDAADLTTDLPSESEVSTLLSGTQITYMAASTIKVKTIRSFLWEHRDLPLMSQPNAVVWGAIRDKNEGRGGLIGFGLVQVPEEVASGTS